MSIQEFEKVYEESSKRIAVKKQAKREALQKSIKDDEQHQEVGLKQLEALQKSGIELSPIQSIQLGFEQRQEAHNKATYDALSKMHANQTSSLTANDKKAENQKVPNLSTNF
ncbi:hypothetical protein [Priestia megaterium]|uniref:hypothetical protein n=1 Tax=Priestia megaterium TaxID=1404 RepID=UPI0038735BEE|nr:hypothetical protein QY062_24600 [Priestia megaterium]